MDRHFSGLIDIGGRKLYLECHGTGSPTVVLVAGYRSSARYWSDDLLQPDAARTMVLPSVAEFTRVCAYDRPRTFAPVGDDVLVGRSDPVEQPRIASKVVAELHSHYRAVIPARPTQEPKSDESSDNLSLRSAPT